MSIARACLLAVGTRRQWGYDAAIAAVAVLQGYTTMAEVIVAYYDLEDDAWLDALCRRPSGRILNFGDVEDAAYWRRAQQVITAAAGSFGRQTG